jgi:hypothetical protein
MSRILTGRQLRRKPALRLSRDPAYLAALKNRLIRNRDGSLLFDTQRATVVIGFSGLFKDLRERCGISDPLIQLSRFPPRPHRVYPHDYSVPRKSHDCPTGCEPSWDYRGICPSQRK